MAKRQLLELPVVGTQLKEYVNPEHIISVGPSIERGGPVVGECRVRVGIQELPVSLSQAEVVRMWEESVGPLPIYSGENLT